ncbi:MAG: hypothetical protein D6693_07965 [Planctomycetota bacterium]|nr:MAG: hypothetical protein D6693_07965 [Planctomycetota bacterium]
MEHPGPPTLAVSLAGLPRSRPPRAWIEWSVRAGFRGVALDASAPGVRPRELGAGARRDLAALLKRQETRLAGLDLFIPPADFVSPSRQDRAIAALTGALELAGDLTRLGAGAACVTAELPESLDPATRSALAEAARSTGARLAEARVPLPAPEEDGAVIPAVDPASLILTGIDPVEALAGLPVGLAALRVSDAAGGRRVELGAGALDVAAYRSLAVLGGAGHVVADLRGLADAHAAARAALGAWSG